MAKKSKTIKQMKKYYLLGAVSIMAAQLGISNLRAEETNTVEIIRQLQQRIERLEEKINQLEGAKNASPEQGRERVQELEHKVKVLERNRELDLEASEAKAKEAPKLTLGSDGFGLSSADGAFAVQLKGLLQVDSRSFFEDHGIKGNDSILLRRLRPILHGTLFRDFDFLFVPDFGGTGNPQIFDAYVNYRYNPALQLQAGKVKSPIGVEQLQ